MRVTWIRKWTNAFASVSTTVSVGLLAGLFPLSLSSQLPVPTGEPARTVEVTGSVADPTGAVVSGARVTVSDERGTTITVTTGATGYFQAAVPAGHYTVSVSAPGFAEQTRSVSLGTSESASVNFVLSGPVPVGEPSAPATTHIPADTPHSTDTPPTPPTGNEAVTNAHIPADVPMPISREKTVTGSFGSNTDLANWLNAQAARGLRIQAALAMHGYLNLFVWVSHPGQDWQVVVPVDTVNSAAKLEQLMARYAEPTVAGVAWVNHTQYLILRTNNP